MTRPKPPTPGHLTTNGVTMEPHEYITINTLLADGNDIEFVEKSRTPHTKSPDICMNGSNWEIKAPTGKTLRPVQRILRRATKQSANIIVDLKRTPLNDKILITALEKYFRELRTIRNLWIITKDRKILKYKK